MTYENEIALLADDIRRYCNNDGRIDEALTQLIKLHQAEVDALAFEARALDKLIAANVCELCLRPFDGLGVCPVCETQRGGLYEDWRSDCG